jgi:hypothetical protein
MIQPIQKAIWQIQPRLQGSNKHNNAASDNLIHEHYLLHAKNFENNTLSDLAFFLIVVTLFVNLVLQASPDSHHHDVSARCVLTIIVFGSLCVCCRC